MNITEEVRNYIRDTIKARVAGKLKQLDKQYRELNDKYGDLEDKIEDLEGDEEGDMTDEEEKVLGKFSREAFKELEATCKKLDAKFKQLGGFKFSANVSCKNIFLNKDIFLNSDYNMIHDYWYDGMIYDYWYDGIERTKKPVDKQVVKELTKKLNSVGAQQNKINEERIALNNRIDKAVQRAIVLVQLGNDITDFDKILASVKI